MNPEQIVPKPYYSFGGYNFFKHMFAEDAVDVDKNLDLFLVYLKNICFRRKDIDGKVLSAGVCFDDNEVLFLSDAKKYQYKYYLFPITRLDAYARLHQLSDMLNEKIDEFKFTIEYEPRRAFSDKYDNSEAVRLIIRDESIPNWKRNLKTTLSMIRSKGIRLINKILPKNFQIVKSRKNSFFDWKYSIRYQYRK